MKKVLILTYYFPPGNFAGSYRIASWAKYLHKFGWYPIIITRRWNDNQSDVTEDIVDNTLSIETTEQYEVHRVPYKQSLRDKIHAKCGNNRFWLLRKTLSFIEIVFQNFTTVVVPYNNILSYAYKYLKNHNKETSVIVASGRPFMLFKFAHELNKRYDIPWVADYRDEWSTCQWIDGYGFTGKAIAKLEARSEKKWLNNAAAITSCSDYWVNKVSIFNQKPGTTILNGYDPADYTISGQNDEYAFTIIYNGTLYATQQVELLITTCKDIWQDSTLKIPLKLIFQGLTADPIQTARVKSLIKDYEQHVTIGDRVSKQTVIAMQKSADLLLMLGHTNIVGNYSSKMFEYLACQVPILLINSDKDVLEQLIIDTQSGFIANDSTEILALLKKLMKLKQDKQPIPYTPNTEAQTQYTREAQTRILAETLDKVLDTPKFTGISAKEELRDILFDTAKTLQIPHLLRGVKKKDKLTALCFHRITYEQDLAVPPLQPHIFEGIIKYCTKHYTIITAEDINIATPKPKLLVTFDDGYADFKDYALPILQKYSVPALMSIVTDTVQTGNPFWTQRIGAIVNYAILKKEPIQHPTSKTYIYPEIHNAESCALSLFNSLVTVSADDREQWLIEHEQNKELHYPKMLNEEDLRSLSKKGITFASHSKTHNYLPFEAEHNKLDVIREELNASKHYLENILNTPCIVYSAPNGASNSVINNIAIQESRYKYILSTESKFSSINKIEQTRIVPRILIYRNSISENILRIEGFHHLLSK